MSTQAPDELQERVQSPAFKLYAEFGRDRFGLLWVIQAVLLAVQTAVTLSPLAEGLPRWLAPALMLPTYLAYLIFRERLWLLLYRRQGHLRLMIDAKRARWNALGRAVIDIGLLVWVFREQLRDCPLGLLSIAAIWAAAFYVLPRLWGRIPGDGVIALWTAFIAAHCVTGQLYESNTAHWWQTGGYLIFAIYAARGIWEHIQFIDAARELQPAAPPQEVNPNDATR